MAKAEHEFARIPKFILEWGSLTPADKLVYMALLSVSDYGKKEAWPSKRYVAELTGLSARQVRLSIDHLLTARLIEETPSTRRTRAYVVTPHQTVKERVEKNPRIAKDGFKRVFTHQKEFKKLGTTRTKLSLALRRACRSGEYFGEFCPAELSDEFFSIYNWLNSKGG